MEHKRIKILAIAGSISAQSSSVSFLRSIAGRYAHLFDVQVDDSLDQLPFFNTDLDRDQVPAVVEQFRRKIEASDGVIICTPEYVFSLPGVLKNALEWTVSTTVFTDKPLAILVAAASGAKAFESLQLIMQTLQANIGEGAAIIISGAKGKLNTEGMITDDQTNLKIDGLITSLLKTINDIPQRLENVQKSEAST